MRKPKKTLTHQTRHFASYAAIPKSYRELCGLCLPRPIHDDSQDEEATAMMLALAGFPRFNKEQQDYLDVLTEFVDEYDKAKNIRLPKISGLDTLKYLLEENGMSAADLSRILGSSRNLGAMILRGERRLTLAHVRTLAKRFRVSADLFLP